MPPLGNSKKKQTIPRKKKTSPRKGANHGTKPNNEPIVGLELFGSVSALKRRKNHDEALHTLRRAAAQVKPIMAKRGWRVGALEEFYPRDDKLLGLNHNSGSKIQVRMRAPGNDGERWLPFDNILGTLLHELTHNERGPHDAIFYKLLDEITKETEDLMASGYTGDGFYATGHRVGRNASHDAKPHEARAIALAAAEKRRAATAGRTAGGRKLGGGEGARSEKLHTPREMAVMAAERRARDALWCGNHEDGSEAKVVREEVTTISSDDDDDDDDEIFDRDDSDDLANGDGRGEMAEQSFTSINMPMTASTSTSATSKSSSMLKTSSQPSTSSLLPGSTFRSIPSQISAIQPAPPPTISIPSTPSDPPSPTNIGTHSPPGPPLPVHNADRKKRKILISSESPDNLNPSAPYPEPPASSSVSLSSTESPSSLTTWTCTTCTLHNDLQYLSCTVCTAERPMAVNLAFLSSGTRTKSEVRVEEVDEGRHGSWACPACTLLNDIQAASCDLCGSVR